MWRNHTDWVLHFAHSPQAYRYDISPHLLFVSFPIALFAQAAHEDLPWSALTPGGHDGIQHSDPSWEGSRKKLKVILQLWDLAL